MIMIIYYIDIIKARIYKIKVYTKKKFSYKYFFYYYVGTYTYLTRIFTSNLAVLLIINIAHFKLSIVVHLVFIVTVTLASSMTE